MAAEENLHPAVKDLEWYHTIDLGHGIVTPGHCDQRPYLEHYRVPEHLEGETVYYIDAASGFLAFECER